MAVHELGGEGQSQASVTDLDSRDVAGGQSNSRLVDDDSSSSSDGIRNEACTVPGSTGASDKYIPGLYASRIMMHVEDLRLARPGEAPT